LLSTGYATPPNLIALYAISTLEAHFRFLGSVLEAPDSYAGNSPDESGAFGKNMSKQANQLYHSFLVRCWFIPAATVDEPPAWRFEVQEVSAEPQKHRFSDFEQLKAFMAAKLTAVAAASNQDGDKNSSV
jgi:hypothetical protein